MRRTIINRTSLLSFILLSSTFCCAQTSVVQDTKGETSLNLGNQGVVAFNAKESSLSFSYGALVGDSPTPKDRTLTYLGITTKSKAKNNISTIIKNEDFQYDGSFGFFVFRTKTYISGPVNRTDHFYMGADYLLSRFKLIDSSKGFSDQVYDESIGGSRFTIGYNQENSFRGTSYVLGIALNGGQRNNTEDLKALTVSSITTYTDTTTSQIRSIQQDQVSAYEVGSYKNSLAYSNFNIDFGPQIAKRFLLLMHPRFSFQQGRKPHFNPAAGIYITKDKAPLEVVAGFQIQIQDYANNSNSTKTRGERTTINLVAGYVF